MSLHDLHDLRGAVGECSRVLKSRGSLVLAVVHPFITARDAPTAQTPEPQFHEPYLSERVVVDRVERNGLRMAFTSVHRPLAAYFDALADAGFAVSRLREHGTGPLPWLLVIRADKRR